MRASIQTKLLTLCIVLVLLTAVGISTTYYVLTKRDKQRESRQRIQIGFDIALHGLTSHANELSSKFTEFQNENTQLSWIPYMYGKDRSVIGSLRYLALDFFKLAADIKKFSALIAADRLMLYGPDQRLLMIYRHQADQEEIGGYVVSGQGNDAYFVLPIDSPDQMSTMMLNEEPIPDAPLPAEVAGSYAGEVPTTISTNLFSDGQHIGIRIAVPINRKGAEGSVGLLIGEIWHTQAKIEEYAALSKTDVNLFAGTQRNIGTLQAQTQLDAGLMERLASCEELRTGVKALDVLSVKYDAEQYYQGQCAFRDAQGTVIGAMSVSLAQAFEQQEIRNILTAVLAIAGHVLNLSLFPKLVPIDKKTDHQIVQFAAL